MTDPRHKARNVASAVLGAVLVGTVLLTGAIAPVDTPQVAARIMA